MIQLLLLVIGLFLVAAGSWQLRQPERTQEFATKLARYSWLRKMYRSEGYRAMVEINGFGLLVMGCAILLFVVVDLAIGVLQ